MDSQYNLPPPPAFDHEAEKSLWWNVFKDAENSVELIAAIPADAISMEGKKAFEIFSTDTPVANKKRAFLQAFPDVISHVPQCPMDQAIQRILEAYHRMQVWKCAVDVVMNLSSDMPQDAKIAEAIAKMAEHHSADRAIISPIADEIANLVTYWQNATKYVKARVPLGFGMDAYRLTGAGKLIIVGARPGNCKTTMALNSAVLQLEHGYGVAFYCREMTTIELLMRIIAIRTGMRYQDIEDGKIDPRITAEMQWIQTKNLRMSCGPQLKHIGQIETWIRQSVRRYGCKVAWLDYLTLIKHDRAKGRMDRRLEVADITRRLKDLSQELEIPIIALAQINRQGDDSIPTVAQLKEAGDIEQDADSIVLLDLPRGSDRKYTIKIQGYNDYEPDKLDLENHLFMSVRKNRSGGHGTEAAFFFGDAMKLGQRRLSNGL